MSRLEFLLEPARCTGCDACRVACAIENGLSTERSWRSVHHSDSLHAFGAGNFHLSLACQHCGLPACLEGCPARAYLRDPETGAVLLAESRCLGCRYCAWVCPYDAPRFEEARGVVEKCTFCDSRQKEGRIPACAVACPTGALRVGPSSADPVEPEFPGLFPAGLLPSLRILGTQPGGGPESAEYSGAGAPAWMEDLQPPPKVSLQKEWSLYLFTMVAALLFGLHTAFLLREAPAAGVQVFLAMGLLGGLASALHLGRPLRAWRALLHVRSSWLSREAAAFALFLAGAGLAQASGNRPAAWAAEGVGLFLLLAADQLYRVAEARRPWPVRSGELLPSGLYLGGLLAWNPWLLLPLAAFRIALLGGSGLPWTLFRFISFLIPATACLLGREPSVWVLLLALLGEGLDRARYYRGLKIPSPAVQLRDARCGSGGPAGT